MRIYYHVYNRAIEGQKLFRDYADYQRFLMCLYFFNSTTRCQLRDIPERWDPKSWSRLKRRGLPLVSLLAYKLLPNQCHLFLYTDTKERSSLFLQKIMTGYTMYCHKKYEKRDRIFASETKYKIITKDAHYFHIPNYIHLNCLDLKNYEWRNGKMHWNEAEQLLRSYRWSSLPHYLGTHKDPILDDAWIKKYAPSPEAYLSALKRWIERGLPTDIRGHTEVGPQY